MIGEQDAQIQFYECLLRQDRLSRSQEKDKTRKKYEEKLQELMALLGSELEERVRLERKLSDLQKEDHFHEKRVKISKEGRMGMN